MNYHDFLKNFELKVRGHLENQKWILDKWTNNIDLKEDKLVKAKRKYNPFKKMLIIGTGFPDFIGFKLSGKKSYEIIGIEVKANGWLDKVEKEKCMWYLKNKIFSKIIIAKKAKKVIGIESVPEAIIDAKENAKLNKIDNVEFFVGDMAKIFNKDFIQQNGFPDIIITDPPRDGMHKKVVEQILHIMPNKIVYVSCNSATQARDLALMKDHYSIVKTQAVDMFPQTHHVENVVLLELKNVSETS